MKNGKGAKFGSVSRMLALVLALLMMTGCITGGTLAWLTARTPEMKNTFMDSDIGVGLEESTGNSYQMIPGWTIRKDPRAWVTEESEDCYLFVKVEETGGSVTYTKADGTSAAAKWTDFLTYEIADGWKLLTGEGPGKGATVYYRVFAADSADTKGSPYAILKNDQVAVLSTVTREMMDALTDDSRPALTVTAYASELSKNQGEPFTAAEAWENLNSDG